MTNRKALPDKFVAALVSAAFALSVFLLVNKIQDYRADAGGTRKISAGSAIDSNGTHLVGAGLSPGSYVSEGGQLCYWARLADGSVIIQEQVTDNTARVTVDVDDYALHTLGCGYWRRVS